MGVCCRASQPFGGGSGTNRGAGLRSPHAVGGREVDGKVAKLPCEVVVALLRHLGAGEVAVVAAVGGSRRFFDLGAAVDQRCVSARPTRQMGWTQHARY